MFIFIASDLVRLIFRLEMYPYLENSCNSRSSAYAAILYSICAIWNPFMFGFDISLLMNGSSEIMNKMGGRGQPCLVPLAICTVSGSR